MMGDIKGAGDHTTSMTSGFGLMGVAFGVGLVVGPSLGGILGTYHELLPFIVASCLNVIALIITTVFLEETLPPKERKPFQCYLATPISALKLFVKYPKLIAVIFPLLLLELGGVVHVIWYVKF